MLKKISSISLIINLISISLCSYLVSKTSNDSNIVDNSDKILKVKGIVVVDSLGIERVIVGANIPDPNWSYGYRSAARGKGGSVSGVMLFDSEGQERGGYVTDDGFGNAFLTLDSKSQQHLLLLCEPQGGAALQLWDRNENNVSINVNDTNASMSVTANGKKVTNHEKN